MKRFSTLTASRSSRRLFLVATLSLSLLGAASGCALFSKKTDDSSRVSEFEDEPETEESDGDSSHKTIFDSERNKQSEMSDFVSAFGRKSKTPQEVDPGQTFLMSDKAKEIYANTER